MNKARFELWQGGVLVALVEAPEAAARAGIQQLAALCLEEGPITIWERRHGYIEVVAEARLAE